MNTVNPHGPSVDAAARPDGTPDQTRSAAQERLERFAVEKFVEQHPEWKAHVGSVVGPLDLDGLQEAAEEELRRVQGDLVSLQRHVGNEPLDPAIARTLARDRYHAITALLEVMWQHKRAKQVQLRATGGAPLAICMGASYRVHRRTETSLVTPYVEGPVKFTVRGCYRIFPDATTLVGDMWPNVCEDCNNNKRKPRRDQERELARSITALARGQGLQWYRYYLTLPRNSDKS